MEPDSDSKGHLFVGALLGSIFAYAVLVALLVGVCKPIAGNGTAARQSTMRLPAGAPK